MTDIKEIKDETLINVSGGNNDYDHYKDECINSLEKLKTLVQQLPNSCKTNNHYIWFIGSIDTLIGLVNGEDYEVAQHEFESLNEYLNLLQSDNGDLPDIMDAFNYAYGCLGEMIFLNRKQ